MLRVDPHAHTLHSDGTDTPDGLVRAAKEAQLDLVGITDHDTVAGWEEAERAAIKHGIGLIRGAEVSADIDGLSVHILGLLMDPTNPELANFFATRVQARTDRMRTMVANLRSDYPDLTWRSVQDRAGEAPLGRPHLADELVELGYFPDRSSAFAAALHPKGPHFVPAVAPAPAEAIRMITGAGGVAILAHPQAHKRGAVLSRSQVEEMAEAGLFGIERDHRDHDNVGRQTVERWAEEMGLAISGGSDYHGSGKPNLLGENLLAPGVLAQIEERAALQVVRP